MQCRGAQSGRRRRRNSSGRRGRLDVFFHVLTCTPGHVALGWCVDDGGRGAAENWTGTGGWEAREPGTLYGGLGSYRSWLAAGGGSHV